VVFGVGGNDGFGLIVWDFVGETRTRLTLGANGGAIPIWSLDGSRILYDSLDGKISAKPVNNTRRHVRKITVTRDGPVVRIRFEGDGFLYKMARMLAAAMVRVAQGRATLADLRARLGAHPTGMSREVAPPDGLYLVRVAYARTGTQSG
jgi:hypothetical protein